MKLRAYIIWTLVASAPVLAAAAPATAPTVDTNAPALSVFIMPAQPSEGRDPFFPNSTRPYEQAMTKTHHAVDVTSLKIKGFSEVAGQRFVIINNHTFGEGDEGDVITSEGRIHIKCLTVGLDSVLVESGGTQHVLKISDQ